MDAGDELSEGKDAAEEEMLLEEEKKKPKMPKREGRTRELITPKAKAAPKNKKMKLKYSGVRKRK